MREKKVSVCKTVEAAKKKKGQKEYRKYVHAQINNRGAFPQ